MAKSLRLTAEGEPPSVEVKQKEQYEAGLKAACQPKVITITKGTDVPWIVPKL